MRINEHTKTTSLMMELNRSVGKCLLGAAFVYGDDEITGFHPEKALAVYLLLSGGVSVLISGCAFSIVSTRPDRMVNDADIDCMFDERGNLFISVCLTDEELSPIACITAIGDANELTVVMSASPEICPK